MSGDKCDSSEHFERMMSALENGRTITAGEAAMKGCGGVSDKYNLLGKAASAADKTVDFAEDAWSFAGETFDGVKQSLSNIGGGLVELGLEGTVGGPAGANSDKPMAKNQISHDPMDEAPSWITPSFCEHNAKANSQQEQWCSQVVAKNDISR